MTTFDTRAVDLDAYFARVGYSGPVTPALDVLQAIALQHTLAIPFENLNPLLRRPVPLDVPSLQQKMLRDGRGGWCFEHNILLGSVLGAIGYPVAGLAARVMWNSPPGAITPRSHMVLHVTVAGRAYIVDAGFGGLTLTAPLRLEPDIEQQTPHEPFRLTRPDEHAAGAYVLEARVREEWKALYRFDLQPQMLVDYEVSNWYLCHSPTSHFLTTLVAARVGSDRRYALRNTDFTVHHRDGYTERRPLTSGADVRQTLEQVFGVTIPAGDDVGALFERIVAGANQPLAT